MSKGLSIATWSAAGGPKPPSEDRRKYPKCKTAGCRRRVLTFPAWHSPLYTTHCYAHLVGDAGNEYTAAWLEDGARRRAAYKAAHPDPPTGRT